jgi:phosphatidate cytidylyltransferase
MGKSDLGVRLGVALLLIALAFGALWVGGFGFWLIVSVGGVLMMGEWGMLARATPGEIKLGQYAVSVPIAAMCPLAAGPGFLALGLIAGAFFFLAAVTRRVQLALGAFYVGLPVLALLLLRTHPEGFAITLWTMAVVWAADSGAYFVGRAVGGPKLWPAISPNKTWSGAVGGVVAAVIFTVVYAWINAQMITGMTIILLSPWLAMLSQAGDLFESHLKRTAGVKDSGNVLPGHGGLLDRLDGLVPVAPVVAIVIVNHYWHLAGVVSGKLWW